jgi:hypothetical protein
MQQIPLERADELLRRSALQTDAVVDPRIVHQRIDSPVCLRNAIHRFPAALRRTQIDHQKISSPCAAVAAPQFIRKIFAGFLVAIKNDWNRPFLHAGSRNCGAYPLSASRNHDNLPAELQIHETIPLSPRIKSHRGLLAVSDASAESIHQLN